MHRSLRGPVALLVAGALLLNPLAVFAAPAGAPSGFHGRVFAPDLTTPLSGIVVQAIRAESGKPAARSVTDARGRFSLAGLAAGEYVLLLASAEGRPLAAARLAGRAGEDRAVHLGLPPVEAGRGAVAPAAGDESEEKGGHKGGFWHFVKTPLGATVVFIVGAVVFAGVGDALTSEEPITEHRVSPSD